MPTILENLRRYDVYTLNLATIKPVDLPFLLVLTPESAIATVDCSSRPNLPFVVVDALGCDLLPNAFAAISESSHTPLCAEVSISH